MPPIFKPMTTVMAWALYIIGWVMGLSVFIGGMVTGDLRGPEPAPMAYFVGFLVALAFNIAAIVVMKLRQGMK